MMMIRLLKYLFEKFKLPTDKQLTMYVVHSLVIAITATLIINPKALNAENNGTIGILCGLIFGAFGKVIDSLFSANKNCSKDE
jgi:hypothetical protein